MKKRKTPTSFFIYWTDIQKYTSKKLITPAISIESRCQRRCFIDVVAVAVADEVLAAVSISVCFSVWYSSGGERVKEGVALVCVGLGFQGKGWSWVWVLGLGQWVWVRLSVIAMWPHTQRHVFNSVTNFDEVKEFEFIEKN